mgnify:FL=1
MYQAAQNRYNTLPTRRCGNSGLLLPAVSLGLWHNFGDTSPYENMRALCRTAFDNGITHFDLANNYGPEPGAAERNFGRILHDDLGVYRDELIISTKAGYEMWDGPYGNWGSRKYLLASLDQSLQRLGLDYVDISSFHAEKKSLPSYLSIGRAFFVCSCIINVQDLRIYTPFQIIDLNGSTKETFGMRVIEQTFN